MVFSGVARFENENKHLIRRRKTKIKTSIHIKQTNDQKYCTAQNQHVTDK